MCPKNQANGSLDTPALPAPLSALADFVKQPPGLRHTDFPHRMGMEYVFTWTQGLNHLQRMVRRHLATVAQRAAGKYNDEELAALVDRALRARSGGRCYLDGRNRVVFTPERHFALEYRFVVCDALTALLRSPPPKGLELVHWHYNDEGEVVRHDAAYAYAGAPPPPPGAPGLSLDALLR